MKIKKGDKVKILKGKDAGKIGKVVEARPKENKVLVEGLNLVWKHLRPRRAGEKGQKIQVPKPIDVSNVMLVCPKCSEPTRVGFFQDQGKKVRQCKKCKAIID